MVPDDPQQVTNPRRALPKRLRFEIMRRDNHACRYCGQMAPDVKLTVDHVVPVVLGGTDDPTNLVAACADCNAGKSSVGPDASTVQDVAQDALRFRAALWQAQVMAHDVEKRKDIFTARFFDIWNDWTFSAGWEDGKQVRKNLELPANWSTRIETYFEAGLTDGDIVRAVEIAMTVKCRDEFSYMIGILNNIRAERVAVARALMFNQPAGAADGTD